MLTPEEDRAVFGETALRPEQREAIARSEAFEDALRNANILAEDLGRLGIRYRITIDDGDGLTAELQSHDRPRRPR